MHSRCYREKDPSYKYYGGRGIKVCDEWKNIANFENWVKEHPYFEDVDWDKYLRKEIEPPFAPNLEGELDLKYFDKCFTDEPVNSNRSTINSRSNITSEYNGFTYMTQSVGKDIIECTKNDEEQEQEQELL